MSAVVDATVRSVQRSHSSWLREPVVGFLESLVPRRLKRGTLRINASRLFRFAEFAEQQGANALDQLPRWVEPFLQEFHPRQPGLAIWRSTLARFIAYLMQQGAIPAPQPMPLPPRPYAELVAGYAAYLREHRGVCEPYLRDIQRYCSDLVAYLHGRGVTDLRTLGAQAIHDFITAAGKGCARTTVGSKCIILRGFLAYLHRRGVTTTDLSGTVLSPRIYKHEQCPRFLTAPQVEAALAAVDPQAPRGRRNYAMLLLLAVYGLRGIEVRRLNLEDIDWRTQLLHIRRRKAGNNTTYPLAPAVGEAIVAYLRHDRPDSPHRQVFLSSKPPFPPLVTTGALGRQARKFMALAGIEVARPGTHTFRYSCAQRLLESEVSLKEIGDYLGHQDPSTTRRYTKIALGQLREVALNDGEDLL